MSLYASVVTQKKYTEIHNAQFTFQSKRRRINCLTEKLTLCISSLHTYVWTHFVLKACDDSCSPHPNITSSYVCFSVSFSNSAVDDPQTITAVCGHRHHYSTTLLYLHTCTHILFYCSSLIVETFSALAAPESSSLPFNLYSIFMDMQTK